mmetsp:Transcript_17819/g.42825  ORF Transcript_17819/g.42825 Transcript_17819/m.42825 type:complete len:228 (-) Transcript_17819:361-1044(-)
MSNSFTSDTRTEFCTTHQVFSHGGHRIIMLTECTNLRQNGHIPTPKDKGCLIQRLSHRRQQPLRGVHTHQNCRPPFPPSSPQSTPLCRSRDPPQDVHILWHGRGVGLLPRSPCPEYPVVIIQICHPPVADILELVLGQGYAEHSKANILKLDAPPVGPQHVPRRLEKGLHWADIDVVDVHVAVHVDHLCDISYEGSQLAGTAARRRRVHQPPQPIQPLGLCCCLDRR